MNKNQYLTESTLKEFLEIHFEDVIHNKFLNPKNCLHPPKVRPDFHIPSQNLVVEFDGFRHYSQARTKLQDDYKNVFYKTLGLKIIRIPYFVQLSSEIIKFLFGIDGPSFNNYPHGFVDRKALLPADFCSLGIIKFKEDLENFSIIKGDILNSLYSKIEQGMDDLEVFPDSFEI